MLSDRLAGVGRAHGESCTASGSVAVGMGSEAAGSGSRALGLYAKARLAGQTAAAQGRFVAAGDAQEAVYRVAIATTNATPAELRIAGRAGCWWMPGAR